MDRMLKFYRSVDVPAELVSEIEAQVKRLEAAREKFGDVISPDKF